MELEKNVIIIKRDAYQYPKDAPFRPFIRYPEYKGGGSFNVTENCVYDMVREGFYLSGYDKKHYGTPEWNPLGEFISQGDFVVLKPNLVMDENGVPENGTDCLYTQPSVVAAVVDYVIIALKGTGKIIIGDAPMQECDFDALLDKSGYRSLLQYYQQLLKGSGITIEIADFRELKSKVVNGIHHSTIEKISGKIVDIKSESEFAEETDYFYENMRITNYDPNLLKQHHNAEINEYYVNDHILSADVVINMPKPKTHRKAGVTISMKNMVGINCRKEYLPHHTNGSPKEGGDEYLNTSMMKRAYDRLLDKRNYFAQTKKDYRRARLCNFMLRAVSGMVRITRKDAFNEGNWYGNDTISRTIVDLNKILFYADKNGAIQLTKQRRYLIIADMIVSGEKEGPIKPSPKDVGIIAIGEDPVCFDEAILELMGAKRAYIHTINHARSPKGSLALTEQGSIPYLISNDKRWNNKHLDDLTEDNLLYFVPTRGWKEAFKTRNK